MSGTEDRMFDIFRKQILSPTDVIEKAIRLKLVPPGNTPEHIKLNFSSLIENLQWDAYDIYLEEESATGKKTIEEFIRKKISPSATVDDVIHAVSSMFTELDRFFLSLTQSRRPRAGKAFEIIIRTLFKNLDYPFDEQQIINGQPDFLMPHRRHYDTNPMDSIIFTAKRTLRERWRQIVTEGTRGLGFFLATIDETISVSQLTEMLHHRIYLVVPERIKKETANYRAKPNVISFEHFFIHHLDPAMTRWKAGGII